MQSARISIWFFIGVLLTVYGVMILGYGIVEWVNVAHFGGQYPQGVQLPQLHAPLWWGAILEALGLFYTIKFRPSRGK